MEENELKSEDRDQVILHIIEQDRKRLNHANSHLGDLSVRPKTVSYWSEQKESRNTRGYEYWSEFKRSLLSNESVSFDVYFFLILAMISIHKLFFIIKNFTI